VGVTAGRAGGSVLAYVHWQEQAHGPDATFEWLPGTRIPRGKPGAILINHPRGVL